MMAVELARRALADNQRLRIELAAAASRADDWERRYDGSFDPIFWFVSMSVSGNNAYCLWMCPLSCLECSLSEGGYVNAGGAASGRTMPSCLRRASPPSVRSIAFSSYNSDNNDHGSRRRRCPNTITPGLMVPHKG